MPSVLSAKNQADSHWKQCSFFKLQVVEQYVIAISANACQVRKPQSLIASSRRFFFEEQINFWFLNLLGMIMIVLTVSLCYRRLLIGCEAS